MSSLPATTCGAAPRLLRRMLVLVGLGLLAAACGSSTEEGTVAQPAATPTTAAAPTTTAPTTTTTAPTTTTTTVPTTAAPTTTTPPTPTLRTPAPEAPLQTHIMGDSTAYDVGFGLVRANWDEGLLATEVLFRASSGLTRTDFFDWPYYLRFVMETNPPEVMLLSLGANDGQDLVAPDGTIHLIGEPGWNDEYRRRVEEVSRLVTDSDTDLYWIGQPLSRDPDHTVAMTLVNEVFRAVAEDLDQVRFIDIWEVLGGPDGEFRQEMDGPDGEPVEIRASDGIHLTDVGADLAAGHVLDALRRDWGG